MSSVCSVGRAAFVPAILFLLSIECPNLDKLEGIYRRCTRNDDRSSVGHFPNHSKSDLQHECTRALEAIRVCSLFACHLCIDSFHTDSSSNSAAGETPEIPQIVIEGLYSHQQLQRQRQINYNDLVSNPIVEALRNLLDVQAKILRLQAMASSVASRALGRGDSVENTLNDNDEIIHMLMSPLVTQMSLRFFSEYIRCVRLDV